MASTAPPGQNSIMICRKQSRAVIRGQGRIHLPIPSLPSPPTGVSDTQRGCYRCFYLSRKEKPSCHKTQSFSDQAQCPACPSSHLESTLLSTPSYFLCPEAKSIREPPYQIRSGHSLTEPYAKATCQSSTLADSGHQNIRAWGRGIHPDVQPQAQK